MTDAEREELWCWCIEQAFEEMVAAGDAEKRRRPDGTWEYRMTQQGEDRQAHWHAPGSA